MDLKHSRDIYFTKIHHASPQIATSKCIYVGKKQMAAIFKGERENSVLVQIQRILVILLK